MDIADLRADAPALETCTYFNAGASGPSPRHVAEAATDFLERHAFDAPGGDGPHTVALDSLEATRETVA